MIKSLKQLFYLLTPRQRKRFYILQIMIAIMALIEIIGIVSIVPFMTLVGDTTQLQQDTIIAKIFQASGINSESQFILLLGFIVIFMLSISAATSMFCTWRLCMFANNIGAEISDTLYTYYLKQEWLFHSSGSSAAMTKKIAAESLRVTNGVLVPFMTMNARILLAFFLSLGIFIYNPIIAMIGSLFFAAAYFVIYSFVKMRIYRNGIAVSDVHEKRFRLMNEGFGGIRDVLLLGMGMTYMDRFNRSGKVLAHSQGTNQTLAQIPRYFMELIAFGSIISLVLYLVISQDSNIGILLPTLSIYALATFKLLPAFQQIYVCIATIRGNISGFESIQQDLIDSKRLKHIKPSKKQGYLLPKKNISIENVTFNYPKKAELALNQINISIAANTTIGIAGPSGSGKSTLIDILLGLIKPQRGQLKIDGVIINDENRRLWQNTIGFVSQSIFLSERSIAENIAFGIPSHEIDLKLVNQAVKHAYLDEFIKNLENGIHTKVGERGVQLSGGQRQRIGIARALYNKAEVLVFDEATSSLDGISEKMIMESIDELSDLKTIIMVAHRLKTIQKCDQIFFIEKGKVIDQGTYEHLVKNNEHFRNMAALA